MAFVEKRIDNSVIWSNPVINITSAQFDPLWYREHATVIAEPTGRGAVCIYAHNTAGADWSGKSTAPGLWAGIQNRRARFAN